MHQSRQKLTNCWSKNQEGSGSIDRSFEAKLTGCWKKIQTGQAAGIRTRQPRDTSFEAKTHVLLEEASGEVRRRITSFETKTHGLLEEAFGQVGRRITSFEAAETHHPLEEESGRVRRRIPSFEAAKTHQLLEEESGVRQRIQTGQAVRHIIRGGNDSLSVGRRIRTGQAAQTHQSRRKLTIYGKKNPDGSGSIDTPFEPKTHALLEEESRWLRQRRHINRGKNSPAVGRRIPTGQTAETYHSRGKLIGCWKKNPDGSGSGDTSFEGKTHRLLEEGSRRVRQGHTSMEANLTGCWKKLSRVNKTIEDGVTDIENLDKSKRVYLVFWRKWFCEALPTVVHSRWLLPIDPTTFDCISVAVATMRALPAGRSPELSFDDAYVEHYPRSQFPAKPQARDNVNIPGANAVITSLDICASHISAVAISPYMRSGP
ncbi:hypothetical protein DFH09DRAFT_1086792 [Mycena vulgaris]|nr:hypothetical protein DFH09DRAFT_1086792 [Mycena vulgaris]